MAIITKPKQIESAFGKAMTDSIKDSSSRTFIMKFDGYKNLQQCSTYLHLRQDERNLIRNLHLKNGCTVLDYGCGAGRHLKFIREICPTSNCYGIETCHLLSDYCQRTIHPITLAKTFQEFAGVKFDLIMIMGAYLGTLGNEQDATQALKDFANALNPDGIILIETGNPFGVGHTTTNCVIEYGEIHDEFIWGHAGQDWITTTLENFDCLVEIIPSGAGDYFFAKGTKM